MDPIVTRLLKSRSSLSLKESMSLYEAEADEEYEKLNNEESDEMPEDSEDMSSEEDTGVEDDSTAPEQGSPDDAPPSSSSGSLPDFEVPEEDAVPPEESEEASEEEGERYENPLDNQYAVYHTLGDDVSLSFEGDTQETREGIIDGYDPEGFYRVRWSDGTTTNGLTDIALEGLVKKTNECVCGGTHFINEGKRTVCDKCGRPINEGATLLSADKDRPKGKKMIRSEAHPMSTATRPNITESEELSDSFEVKCDSCGTTSTYTNKDISRNVYPSKSSVRCKHPNCNNHIIIKNNKSIKDSIKEAFMKSRMNEIHEDEEEGSVFDKLKQNLDNEFWTRQNELVEDIEELGFTVEEINGEYVVVSHDEDEDNAYQIYLGGTSRTFTLDFNRARIV